jgi:MFS transporter, NHS family, xanthosine permease
MNIKFRLIVMNFLQFFIWGAWLISMGGYMLATFTYPEGQQFGEIGDVYATMGWASLFMPALLGIVADRWVNAERVLGLCHLAGAGLLIWASTLKGGEYDTFYYVMYLNSCVYMPTIALNNTVSYTVLGKNRLDVVKDFPPIRVWGTVGFIAAMWLVDLNGWNTSPFQLYVSAGASLVLGLYAFTMPACPPDRTAAKKSLVSSLGLDAFVLFKRTKMAVFFLFAMFLGAALQITNAFGTPFLGSFEQEYADTFAVKHPVILISISQISETLFILTIPFFLRRFGIKKVMLMSIFAWVFRFGLFGIGNPADGFIFLVLSMIIYGMAFDFFNISGSLFVEKEAPHSIRASAQGLFMLMTNGIGAILGGKFSGMLVDHFTTNGISDWQTIWLCFAGYALVIGLIFPFAFRYKHDPTTDLAVKH